MKSVVGGIAMVAVGAIKATSIVIKRKELIESRFIWCAPLRVLRQSQLGLRLEFLGPRQRREEWFLAPLGSVS